MPRGAAARGQLARDLTRPDLVRIECINLDELVEAILAKVRGLGDRDWRHDGTPMVQVELDPQRITQAVRSWRTTL